MDQRPLVNTRYTEPDRRETECFEFIGTVDNFLNRTLIVKTLRSTINKLDLIKLKSFCKAKHIVHRIKWQPIEGKRVFTNSICKGRLISKIYKALKKLDINKPNNPIKNGVQIYKEEILNRGISSI